MIQPRSGGKRLRLATGVAALVVLASCATSFDMSGERIAPPGPEWGVVIGSVLVQPEEDASGTIAAGRDAAKMSYEFDVVQIQPGDPAGTNPYAQQYQLVAKAGEERVFLSRLRPGQYLIREFHEAAVAGLGGELDVVFTAAPGEVRYVGRVRVEIPRRVSSGKTYRFTVDDARAQTLAQLSEQHADLTKAVVDSPMQARVRPAP